MTKAKMVIETVSICGFDCYSLKSVREEIDELIKEHGEDATLDIDMAYEQYGNGSQYISYSINKRRPETKVEASNRKKELAKRAADQEVRERKEFERLQKKFEEEK